MSGEYQANWWDSLRHFGLLLAPKEVKALEADFTPDPLSNWYVNQLRRELTRFEAGDLKRKDWVAWVLRYVCDLGRNENGQLLRGQNIPASWTHTLVTRESLKPTHLWQGSNGSALPVFAVDVTRVGVGRGRKVVSDIVQWLRAASLTLAVLTNGREWRLIYAGLDFDAGCEWHIDQWFAEGEVGPQVDALRLLLQRDLLQEDDDGDSPLLAAILSSRRGQAELSSILGERVREAVELLVQSHRDALTAGDLNKNGPEIYRAAVRVVMRLVVILFAESRDMLPRSDPAYHNSYGLGALFEDLQKLAARGRARLNYRFSSWPRILALFRLIYGGSTHPDLQVQQYGGELFAPGSSDSGDALSRALHVFENGCFDPNFQLMPDAVVHKILDLMTRTQIRIRQGRSTVRTTMPVDFSDLSSEYIGILYEGLLDYELRAAASDNPVIFIAVGNEPALPLDRLEAMEDRDIKSLFESLKDTSSSDDAEEAEAPEEDELQESDADASEQDELPDELDIDDTATDVEGEEEEETPTELEATRARALEWTRRACLAAKLVRRPGAEASLEALAAFEQKVDAKARQLVRRTILPGDWYLVRWGGTRKGSGTFYTRPALAVPTVQRALRPLAYDPPKTSDGSPNADAPAEQWTPKTPETILGLKVCDPACGSGSFPLAALRFLTDALYASLFAHGHLDDDWRRPLPMLLGLVPQDQEETLGSERLPSAPDADDFEERTKAVLRRYIVEHCLYGVDFDPLSTELCRLALWIETMNPDLPFSFLDHKIKCGNSLVGAWFDTFAHYPAMAWSREGGDKSHNNGVHFDKEQFTKAIKAFKTGTVKPDLERFLMGRDLIQEDFQEIALEAHETTMQTLSALHDLPVHSSAERGRRYREEFLGCDTYRQLKDAMDLWCAVWFWPAEELNKAPLPTNFANPDEETQEIASNVARRQRFFHWELEFPDVFVEKGSGFDAVIGNPPWDIAKPSSKEYFSNIDPLYRSYGKQHGLRKQTELFVERSTESDWIAYNAASRALSNFVKYASNAFGDPAGAEKSGDRFVIARGSRNETLHALWRDVRATSIGFSHAKHPFGFQGSADVNLYKLFIEQGHSLLKEKGRLGFIVPSGLYSDDGSRQLRKLLMYESHLEWLFGFINWKKIFPGIYYRFKFVIVIATSAGAGNVTRAAFTRVDLSDWEFADRYSINLDKAFIENLSPISLTILEVREEGDLDLLRDIHDASDPLGRQTADEWSVIYSREFDMSNDSRLFTHVELAEQEGLSSDDYFRWGQHGSTKGEVNNQRALPLYEGRMLSHFDFSSKSWVSGSGRSAVWSDVEPFGAMMRPQYLIGEESLPPSFSRAPWPPKLAIMDIVSATNARTAYAAVIPNYPCNNAVPVLTVANLQKALVYCCVLNSLVFDFAVRCRVGGLHLTWNYLSETPVPRAVRDLESQLVWLGASLSLGSPMFAPSWLLLKDELPNNRSWRSFWAVTRSERLRLRCVVDAIMLFAFGLTTDEFRRVIRDCDIPKSTLNARGYTKGLDPRGFWRVDKDQDPERRQTILSLISACDLEEKINDHGGDLVSGVNAFLNQNNGEGWLLPSEVRLKDYGLGRSAQASEYRQVAEYFGERFLQSQLNEDIDRSWSECTKHAEEILGAENLDAILESPDNRQTDCLGQDKDRISIDQDTKQRDLF